MTVCVKYMGSSAVKTISAARWLQHTGEVVEESTWNEDNSWSIPTSEFTAAQLRYFEGNRLFVTTEGVRSADFVPVDGVPILGDTTPTIVPVHGAPTDNVGRVGDFALDLDSGTVYGPKQPTSILEPPPHPTEWSTEYAVEFGTLPAGTTITLPEGTGHRLTCVTDETSFSTQDWLDAAGAGGLFSITGTEPVSPYTLTMDAYVQLTDLGPYNPATGQTASDQAPFGVDYEFIPMPSRADLFGGAEPFPVGTIWPTAPALPDNGGTLTMLNSLLARPLLDTTTAATTLGTVIGAVAVIDANGTTIGYLPMYDEIS